MSCTRRRQPHATRRQQAIARDMAAHIGCDDPELLWLLEDMQIFRGNDDWLVEIAHECLSLLTRPVDPDDFEGPETTPEAERFLRIVRRRVSDEAYEEIERFFDGSYD